MLILIDKIFKGLRKWLSGQNTWHASARSRFLILSIHIRARMGGLATVLQSQGWGIGNRLARLSFVSIFKVWSN